MLLASCLPPPHGSYRIAGAELASAYTAASLLWHALLRILPRACACHTRPPCATSPLNFESKKMRQTVGESSALDVPLHTLIPRSFSCRPSQLLEHVIQNSCSRHAEIRVCGSPDEQAASRRHERVGDQLSENITRVSSLFPLHRFRHVSVLQPPVSPP